MAESLNAHSETSVSCSAVQTFCPPMPASEPLRPGFVAHGRLLGKVSDLRAQECHNAKNAPSAAEIGGLRVVQKSSSHDRDRALNQTAQLFFLLCRLPRFRDVPVRHPNLPSKRIMRRPRFPSLLLIVLLWRNKHEAGLGAYASVRSVVTTNKENTSNFTNPASKVRTVPALELFRSSYKPA